MHNAHKTLGRFGLSVDLIMRALIAFIFLFNWSHGFRTKVYQISNLSEFSIHAKLSTLSDLQCSFHCFNEPDWISGPGNVENYVDPLYDYDQPGAVDRSSCSET